MVFHKSSVGLNEGGQCLSATPLTSPTEPSPGLDIFPGAFGTAAEMDTGHIAQSPIQWAHHCPALCWQGRPNFPGQLPSCQLPTPFQHGGGGRHPTVGTKREPRYAQQGRVVFIGGGPNCRTWSIPRHIPKPGAPTPVRGRTPETLWGLPHLDHSA